MTSPSPESVIKPQYKAPPSLGGGAEIRIDPSKNPTHIQFQTQGGHAIYKVEGNRLYIALKGDDDRPGLFSTDLKAGADRAIVVVIFKKV